MTEISELEKKRALNIIWAAAENYSFSPDFKAYNTDGSADLYWNFIIGSVRKYYEYGKIEKVFHALSAYEDSFTYESLFWLGLENALFLKASVERPALGWLRRNYAVRACKDTALRNDNDIYSIILRGHCLRYLNQPSGLDRYNEELLNELEILPELTTDEVIDKISAFFNKWFQISVNGEKPQKNHFFPGLNRRNTKGGFSLKKKHYTRYRKFGIGIADRPESSYGGEVAGSVDRKRPIASKLSEAELWEFIQAKFGKSIYSGEEAKKVESAVCTGNHKNCHLLITDGKVSTAKINNGFEALQREKEALQKEKNRAYYHLHEGVNNIAVSRLREKLLNSILMYLQPSAVKSNAGELQAGVIWRAIHLGDPAVFTRTNQGDSGNISVDILLDASTSQKGRQEKVSTQGYIIAAALTQCHIPCRVMSFCSMTGYTVVKIYRDYMKPADNEKIFDYVANGCNRDGLAIRMVHYLTELTTFEHKIVIILSDVKPNDVVKMEGNGEEEFIPYEGASSVIDTALEVRKARSDGLSVICVFTGDDEDVPSARLVYGHDLARIKSIDKLADVVGTLLQLQIKNM